MLVHSSNLSNFANSLLFTVFALCLQLCLTRKGNLKAVLKNSYLVDIRTIVYQ